MELHQPPDLSTLKAYRTPGESDSFIFFAKNHSSIPLTQILQLSRNASTTNLMHVTAI